MPTAIASRACVGYWAVTSSQVLTPTTLRKMAPVANIPTVMAAIICQKCLQNGPGRRLCFRPCGSVEVAFVGGACVLVISTTPTVQPYIARREEDGQGRRSLPACQDLRPYPPLVWR